tara:strand:- start:227 stop:1177 length:951 start_codon:yes stop_codon:yes gene_type:complete
MKYKNVIVTGGSGFVGRRLQKIRPEWKYISSCDYDLTDRNQVQDMFFKNPSIDAVVHLAGRVGGIKSNANNQAKFFYDNVMINTNVLHEAFKAGVSRVLSSLSSCAFPDIVENYPFESNTIFSGPPAITNFSYGYAKRMLLVQSTAYRKQYDVNFSCFCPCNLYGPDDNFNSENSHFVPAMIKRLSTASDGDELIFWGTGKPLRQQLYIDDLAMMIPLLLERHNTNEPIIVATDDNHSIREMIDICCREIGKNVTIKFNNNLDGQFRKDGSNVRMKIIAPEVNLTPFRDGVKKTYEWYINEISEQIKNNLIEGKKE